MPGKIRNSRQLMTQSWNIIKSDKSLLLLPFLGSLCAVIVFALAWAVLYAFHQPGLFQLRSAFAQQNPIPFIAYFLAYLGASFATTFFNTALISLVFRRLRNEPATIAIGLEDARSRLRLIAEWSLIMATVGVIMRMIEKKSSKLGTIILARLFTVAFSVAGFLALPVLVAENKRPVAAFKESARLLRKTWGEQIVGSISLGLMFGALLFLTILAMMAGFIMTLQSGLALTPLFLTGVLLIAITGATVIFLSSMSAAVNAVFRSALYLYARDGSLANGFTEDLLKQSLLASKS